MSRRFTSTLWKNGPSQQASPKIITFDAYNTLYTIKNPVIEQYCEVGKKYGIEANPKKLIAKFSFAFKRIQQEYPLYGKHSGITPTEWWNLLIRDIFEPIQLPNIMLEDILKRFEGESAYSVYPDVREFLEELKTNHPNVVLGIISNTDPTAMKVLENLDLRKYFGENIYLSYDLELKKPDPGFFNYALLDILQRNKALAISCGVVDLKKHVWHIGDEQETDVVGAYNAGLSGVLIDRINDFGFYDRNSSVRDVSRNRLTDDELSLRKISANFTEASKSFGTEIDIVQTGQRQYAVANFNSLKSLLFGHYSQ